MPVKTKQVSYHGIPPGEPGGTNGLRNPERGWRLETNIAEPPGDDVSSGAIHGHAAHLDGCVSPGYNDHWWMLDAQRYEPFGLTLAQAYCYLDRFVGRPLSDEKLALIEQSLGRIRQRGMKVLLRFAYEKDDARTGGPTLQDIMRHLDQLEPVIRANADVIYVLQAGLVGAWGEWHCSTHDIEKDHGALAAIVARLMAILPPGRMIQVRAAKYKRWVLEQPVLGGHRVVDGATAYTDAPFARIGFHNDGFLAGNWDGATWPEPPFFSNPGNPEFDYWTAESAYVPVDGELFWRDTCGRVDGLRAIVRMRLHHYASFGLWHSYSGREGSIYGIDQWMQELVTPQFIREHDLSFSDSYFNGPTGSQVPRTQFQYITDHLGYRIELQRARFPEVMQASDALSVVIDLVNRGFSTIHNPRPVEVVLIDAAGRVLNFPVASAKPQTWQPYTPGDTRFIQAGHQINLSAALPPNTAPGWYQVGLWLPDAAERLRLDPRYAIRVANRGVPWWVGDHGKYGVNILGMVQITP